MKPDGTHTVQELLEIINNELQSWERAELADKLTDYSMICDYVRQMDRSELAEITGYWWQENEPDPNDFIIDDYTDDTIIFEVMHRHIEEECLAEMDERIIIDYVKDNDLL